MNRTFELAESEVALLVRALDSHSIRLGAHGLSHDDTDSLRTRLLGQSALMAPPAHLSMPWYPTPAVKKTGEPSSAG